MDEDRKRTKKHTIYLPEGVYQALRFLAYKKDTDVSPICVNILRDYLQRHERTRRFLGENRPTE